MIGQYHYAISGFPMLLQEYSYAINWQPALLYNAMFLRKNKIRNRYPEVANPLPQVIYPVPLDCEQAYSAESYGLVNIAPVK